MHQRKKLQAVQDHVATKSQFQSLVAPASVSVPQGSSGHNVAYQHEYVNGAMTE